jgi:Deoxyribonuclease II
MDMKIVRASIAIAFALVLALGATPSLAGQCIVPSADVVTAAVLRAAPSTSGARVGTLKPGQSLAYVSSQASWYAGQQADGSAVFVSKRWTQVTACQTAPALSVAPQAPATAGPESAVGPSPYLATGHAVQWWFVFKFNAVRFPGCGTLPRPQTCAFGGSTKTYSDGQQFVYASSESAQLAQGTDCAGTSVQDPIGATYDQIYNGQLHYVVWNDQFKGDPDIPGCGANCNSPWGHSKGIVAWDDAGNATVMQVTTPSWPGAGNQQHPRKSDGNTLGCVNDDNVEYSQDFFSLQLSKDDLVKLLQALQNASVATDPTDPQIVSNGGPGDVQSLVTQLGHKSTSTKATIDTLSSGVRLISKPSALHVPPWQLVSSLLGSIPLRAATWWATPTIASTTATTEIQCWDAGLAKPGPVAIATSGMWNGTTFGLQGLVADGNHAKIGVSTDDDSGLTIFGDMNQQGTLTGTTTPTGACKSSQNGRGGIFFVVHSADLSKAIGSLIGGSTAPTQ